MNHTKKTHVYVAGPITKGDQFINVRTAIECAERLRAAGFVPFVPHISSLWHMIAPVHYEAWMDWDFAWISRCDALFRIPGESSGADREIEFAKSLGLPVFHEEQALIAWDEYNRSLGA